LLSAFPATADDSGKTAVRPTSGTNVCTDLEGRPESCPESVPKLQTESRNAQVSVERSAAHNFIRDQQWFWTSPLRIRENHLPVLLPFTFATAAVISSDQAIERHLPDSQSTIHRSRTFSDAGAAAFVAAGAGAYLWGRASQNDHLRATGVLSTEALVNSLVAAEVIKLATGRERPLQGDGRGDWFQGGQSFPSQHAAASWSVATVLASQYPGWLTRLFAYGGAAAVSAARVTGRKHFASDVLVGSALGWYMGQHVVRVHERQSGIADASWGTFERAPDEGAPRNAAYMGSPYVPIESWVYPAFDRLAALGYVQSGFAGMRPWTRMECARLVEEASQLLDVESGEQQTSEPARIYRSLAAEFAIERGHLDGSRNREAKIESVYTRFTGISGQPLTDGYNFGQTLFNDYGRPYQRGFNNITGVSSYATAGPLALYVRGEYQHAPSAPGLPESARQFVSQADFLPVPPASGISAANRLEAIEAYAGINVDNWQITFGRQSLWWGPGLGGPMMFSNNAEPMAMLRFNRVSPFKLPSILGLLGPIRTEFFLGQLAGSEFIYSPLGLIGQWGHSLDPQPLAHGEKFSFKPTPNFEFSVFRTTTYGGPGYPLNLHSFMRSLFSTGNERAGGITKPGDRRSGVDFTYRIPGLRKWLTFYGDGFTDDQFSPIAYPDRSAWHAGLYLSQTPLLGKLDLRAEGVYTDNPLGGALGRGFYYFNYTWRTGYRNAGNLIGNWIGRDGQGAQAWATYHFTPRNYLQVNFRHQKVSQQFVPGGGTLADIGMRSEFWCRPTLSFSATVQYEQWTFPVIASGAHSNVVTSFQVSYHPK
jgi:hypothetical protein